MKKLIRHPEEMQMINIISYECILILKIGNSRFQIMKKNIKTGISKWIDYGSLSVHDCEVKLVGARWLGKFRLYHCIYKRCISQQR